MFAKHRRVQAAVGSEVELICHGHHVDGIRWLFNGKSVHETTSGRIRSLNIRGTHLLVTDVTEDDAGSYTCIGSNANGYDEDTMTLEVVVIPDFITRPENVMSYPGEKVLLECAAVGVPKPELYWIKEDPDGRSNLLPISGTLIIEHLAPSDVGKYSCVAKNIAGNTSTTAIVRIQGRTLLVYTEWRFPPCFVGAWVCG